MVEVKFAGVKIQYILDSISKTKERNYSTNTFIGSTAGNSVEYVSRTLVFFPLIVNWQRTTLKSLVYLSEPLTWKSMGITT